VALSLIDAARFRQPRRSVAGLTTFRNPDLACGTGASPTSRKRICPMAVAVLSPWTNA
jgi:hypothetical protein